MGAPRMTRKAIAATVLALVATACGGTTPPPAPIGPTEPGDPVAGAAVYGGSCATCHRVDLQGIDGLGNQLLPNEFVASNSEEELADFISIGRPADDPANTAGIDMPPRGGNSGLSDQDLRDVAAYLKAQQ